MRDIRNGTISIQDHKIELNSITYGLLKLIESFNELNFDCIKPIQSPELIKKEIEKLAFEFDTCHNIASNPSRLRMKNHLVQKISERLALIPNLIYSFQDSKNEGIISGISEKIKAYPDINDLDILEKIAHNATKNFTKGNIVNALAEIIYSGQLRLGDDSRIEYILTLLNNHPDIPLEKNIERARAALHFLIGKIQ